MKVTIGPYTSWLGPYQLAEKLLFWKDKDDDSVYELGSKLEKTLIGDICEKIHARKKRKIKIHIDDYDVWNMDSTLAMLIHPMLLKLKGQKHGSPIVDDEDLPEQLRGTDYPDYSDQYTFDFYHEYKNENLIHERWEWVLYEMIWTFEQLNNDWEDQYYDHSEVDDTLGVMEQIKSVKTDWEGLRKHMDRMNNGLRLFGKYYRALWD